MAKRNDRIDQREGEIPMDNEGKNGAQTDKQAVLGRLRDTKALYVVVSACTKLPYVVCDPETFDDEVLVFFKPESRAVQLGCQQDAAEKYVSGLVSWRRSILPLGPGARAALWAAAATAAAVLLWFLL